MNDDLLPGEVTCHESPPFALVRIEHSGTAALRSMIRWFADAASADAAAELLSRDLPPDVRIDVERLRVTPRRGASGRRRR